MLRRTILHARTTNKEYLFMMLILSDLLTFAILILCVPVRFSAVQSCGGFYQIFLLVLFVYQIIVAFRFPTMLCCFMCGERFWRRVKRCFSCLNIVEYEQRVDFQIYNVHDYLIKVNA